MEQGSGKALIDCSALFLDTPFNALVLENQVPPLHPTYISLLLEAPKRFPYAKSQRRNNAMPRQSHDIPRRERGIKNPYHDTALETNETNLQPWGREIYTTPSLRFPFFSTRPVLLVVENNRLLLGPLGTWRNHNRFGYRLFPLSFITTIFLIIRLLDLRDSFALMIWA